MKIVTSEQMSLIEERFSHESVSIDTLMERAGLAVAQKAWEFLGDVSGVPILVLVGPGNNGSDGMVAARHLGDWGADVVIYCALPRKADDQKCQLMLDHGIVLLKAEDDVDFALLTDCLTKVRLVIDSILGTGHSRPIDGILAEILNVLANQRAIRPELGLMALDMPTGLNANTGASDPHCPTADFTVSLGYPKMGLFAFPGAAHVGRLDVVDIGIPAYLADDVAQELITPRWIMDALPKRSMNSHKGTFGRVLVVAGSARYIGAAYLACEAAARVGAGLVTLAIPESLQPMLATKLTETTYLPLPEKDGLLSMEASEIILSEAAKYQALLVGCGLGQGPDVIRLLRQTLLTSRYPGTPIVLDADALNIMSTIPEWWMGMNCQAVLTPHPGEMSRLTGMTTEEINATRLQTTRVCAVQWNKSVALKGAYTVVSSPQGYVRVSPFANPGLASAGTGDVLAGVTAGLLAQGLSTFDAVSCAVYIHGAAGEQVRLVMGDTGMLASDLLPRLPIVIKQVKEGAISFD